MLRCTSKRDLQVYHIRKNGGNGIGNAVVLCSKCHVASSSYDIPGEKPPDFDQETIKNAMIRATYQCECKSSRGCH